MVLDLIPTVSKLYFQKKLGISLSAGQQTILLGVGLQHKSVTQVTEELTLAANQVLALFNKSIRKVVQTFKSIQEKAVGETIAPESRITIQPVERDMVEELKEEGEKAAQDFTKHQQESLSKPSK